MALTVTIYRLGRPDRTAPATGDPAPAQKDCEHPSEATSPTAPS